MSTRRGRPRFGLPYQIKVVPTVVTRKRKLIGTNQVTLLWTSLFDCGPQFLEPLELPLSLYRSWTFRLSTRRRSYCPSGSREVEFDLRVQVKKREGTSKRSRVKPQRSSSRERTKRSATSTRIFWLRPWTVNPDFRVVVSLCQETVTIPFVTIFLSYSVQIKVS